MCADVQQNTFCAVVSVIWTMSPQWNIIIIIICRNFCQLWFTRKFFTRQYYLIAWLNHLENRAVG